jgi:hypothetical protein
MAACGGTVVFEDETETESETVAAGGTLGSLSGPSALWIADREGCGLEAPVSEAEAVLATDDDGGDVLLVVDLAFIDECTGAGGQHILARTPDGSSEMWLGAHACRFFDPSRIDGEVHAGLVRGEQTAGLQQTSADACVTFPGEVAPLASSVTVTAIALFGSQAEAKSFVDTHGLD